MKTNLTTFSIALLASFAFAGAALAQAQSSDQMTSGAMTSGDHMSTGAMTSQDHMSTGAMASQDHMSAGAMSTAKSAHKKTKAHAAAMTSASTSPAN